MSSNQFERGEALEKITQDVKLVLQEEVEEEGLRFLPKAVDAVRKKVYFYFCSRIVCLCLS